MRKTWRTLVAAAAATLLTFGAVAGTAGDARGQELTDDAKETFVDARKRFDAGDFQGALPQFERAYELSQSPNAKLYIARSLRELGRLVEAYAAMEEALRLATDQAGSDARYEQTRDAAATELGALDRQVGKVVIEIADPPPDTIVMLNGSAVDVADVGRPIPVVPGAVNVVVTAPGQVAVREDATLSAGEAKTIVIRLEAPSDGEVPPVLPPPIEDEPATEGGELRLAGIAVAGLGVAGFVMAGVTFGMAEGVYGDLETACGGTRCTDEKYADDVDRGETLDTLANVGLIVGIVGVGAGAAMIAFGGPTERETARVTISPTVGGVSIDGAF